MLEDRELARGVLGVITARGGSKGLPGKNRALLCGKPLIAWSVEAGLASKALERLIVSTDDPVIAAAAEDAGAEVPFLRPPELSQDSTPHLPVIQHALESMIATGLEVSHVVVLQPTSPLRVGADIAGCVALAKQRRADAVISVTPFHGHPSWLKRIAPDGRLLPLAESEATTDRRQDTGRAVLPNGAVFVVTTELIRSGGNWYGSSSVAYEMPPERSIDIDDAWDLHLTQLILADRAR
jgi:CMP-N-acetylneuraminic acid synthetase